MARMTLDTPLTEEEQRFAADNHDLVRQYLNIRRLPLEEWYDVAIFRYLLSVRKWFVTPELHRYRFKTIAFGAMRSAVWNERVRQRKRIKTISLEETIPGIDEITYSDTVTYQNLNFIPYTGGEDVNIKYNVKLPERKQFRGGAKSDEVIAIESFMTGKMKNMCFEYDKEDEAKRKLASIQTYRRTKNHKHIYDVYRNENCIYIVRL